MKAETRNGQISRFSRDDNETSMTAPASERAGGNVRWVIIGMICMVTVINYIDRQTLSVLAPTIRETFGMTNTAYSRVVTTFLLGYTPLAGAVRPFARPIGTRVGFMVFVGIWTFASTMHALAATVIQLALFRFILGVGEAGNWPGAAKAVARVVPGERARVCDGDLQQRVNDRRGDRAAAHRLGRADVRLAKGVFHRRRIVRAADDRVVLLLQHAGQTAARSRRVSANTSKRAKSRRRQGRCPPMAFIVPVPAAMGRGRRAILHRSDLVVLDSWLPNY
jgi:hypothetical protein